MDLQDFGAEPLYFDEPLSPEVEGLLRLGDPAGALARLEKVAEIDTSDRLGVQPLATLAREAITQAAVERLGGKVSYIAR